MKIMNAEDRFADPLTKICRLNALLRCAICAEETLVNTDVVFGDSDKGVQTTLEVAERMSYELERDIERMQRRLKEGTWSRDDDSREGA